MNLAVWAERNGVARVTAYRWFHAGLLPVPARKAGRLILVDDQPADRSRRARTAVYARVSSADQKPDLDRQVARVTAWATTEQIAVDKVVTEVGSALNGHRRKFLALLRDPSVKRIAEGDGRDSARANFAVERLGVALMSLGIINECHRLCVDYAKTRTLWGRNIGQFQLIQLKLAKMEVARINVQNMVFQAIERLKAGKQLTLAEASAIKLYSSEAATDVAMEAVQLFGGNGYMAEYRVEQLARDAKSLMIYAGSNEVQVTHIAKGLLGEPASRA